MVMKRNARLIIKAQPPPGLEAETSERFRSEICEVDIRIYETAREHHGSVHTCYYYFRKYHYRQPAISY